MQIGAADVYLVQIEAPDGQTAVENDGGSVADHSRPMQATDRGMNEGQMPLDVAHRVVDVAFHVGAAAKRDPFAAPDEAVDFVDGVAARDGLAAHDHTTLLGGNGGEVGLHALEPDGV